MKPSAPCCMRTPTLMYRTRPSPAIAARCWIQPSRRNHAAPRCSRQNQRRPLKKNCQRVHQSASQGHAVRASTIPKVFNASAQWSADTVCSRQPRATPKQSAHPKKQNPWIQVRDQHTFRCSVTRARRGRTKQKRSRVGFRQRHGGGRCVPAPFQPSLRLPFTFPLAEPLTEANVKYSDLEKADSRAINFNFLLAYNPSSARFLTIQHASRARCLFPKQA